MTNPVAKKKQLPAFLVLTIIALIAAIVLAATNAVTKDPIAEHAARARREAFGAVLQAHDYQEMEIPAGHDAVSALYKAVDENGNELGYTVVAAFKGYAGPVAVTLGVGPDGKVTGAVIGDNSFVETAGFGKRWQEETDRMEQFKQIDTVEGGSIEAIAGVTLTSNAVLNATNAAINCVNEVRGVDARNVVEKGAPKAPEAPKVELTGGIHEGSARGFASDVQVQLTMDDAGVVTGLAINSAGETPNFGTRAMTEPAFAEQFVGKAAPFTLGGNIEALSGATVTSTAVVEAVNMACAAPENPDAVPFGQEAEDPAVETSGEPLSEEELAELAAAARLEAFAAVLPANDYQEMEIPAGHDAVTALYKAVDENGNELGYTVVAAFKGYVGPVAVTLGVGPDGKVTGAVIGDNSFVETVGFGKRWQEETDRLEQFKQIDTVEGGTIEAIAGVTLTNDAVLNATNAAINCVNEVRGIDARDVVELCFPKGPEVPKAELTGGIHEGSAKGFASDVQVQLTMDDAGVVTGLAINSIGETENFGTRAMTEPAFAEQFVGKTAPFVAGENIDVLSGATVTSKAVIEAVNMACAAPENPDAVPFGQESGEPEDEPAVETSAEPVPEGALVGTAKGFQSDVKVTLTVDENNVITDIKVNSANETSGFGTRCAEDEAFLAQFVGKTIPVEAFDALSGATVTSNAVVAAINAAAPAEEPADELVVVGEPVAELTGTAKGFASDVTVTVSVDANNLITGVVINSAGETPNFGTRCGEDAAFAEQFIGKTIPVEAFDVLSGATVTSNAVVAAINAAAPAEEPADELVVVGEPVAELTGTAKGFASDVTVTVSVDANNLITGVVINSAGETPNFGTRCGEDAAFAEQFIGKTIPVEAFDVLSGATVTSNAVVAAINAAAPAEEPADELVVVGEPVAELTGTAKGFASDVKVTLTVDENNFITGIQVDSSNETPGFGTRCGEDEAFLAQFIGKKATPDLGEGIEALSGATVTSNAVVAAANAAIGVAEAVEIPAADEAVAAAPVTELTGTAKGFASDVTVTVSVDENGVITGVAVDSSNETPGFGTRCAEDAAFAEQFIGKTIPVEAFDVLSGATVTSNAVVAAINAAAPAEEPADELVVVGEPVAELTGTAKGFASDVTVTVSVDANNLITGVVINSAGETPNFGTRCGEDAVFAEQFIGKTIPVEAFDVLSGATVTSNAVVAAINAAAPAEEPADELVVVGEPVVELTGTAKGFASDVTVTLTVDENNVITDIKVDSANETPGFGTRCGEDEAFLAQFVGKTIPVEAFDVLSGATVTSNAVVAAINSVAAIPTDDMSVTGEEGPAAPAVVTMPAYGDADITVTVTFTADGAVETLEVDASTQTPGLGQKCAEESFVSQFIGGTAPFVLGEGIDAVSYATITSQAIVNAVNEAAGAAE